MNPGSALTLEAFTADGSASDDSDGTIVSYRIDWGDGEVTLAAYASHVYSMPGSYAITLTVTDDEGANATASVAITVLARPLEANFAYSPSEPSEGHAVAFAASAARGTPPYAYDWHFGDGTVLLNAGPIVSHAFGGPGSFVVSLTVNDSAGQSTVATRTIQVKPRSFSADFVFSPIEPWIGENVSFAATASRGTGPYTYSWDFGDDTGSFTGQSLDHVFGAAGTYSVNLTVRDASNRTVLVSKPVSVSARPLEADFTYSPLDPNALEAIAFYTSVSGGVPNYTITWTFGDGNTGSGASVIHTYASAGTYTVTMTVTDAQGATVFVSKTVTVA